MTGAEIRAIREKLSVSQVAFAKLLGISHGTLRNWEIDRVSPSGPAEVLLAMAAVYPEEVRRVAASLRK
jgi:putative transcriptional regulator